MTDDESSTPSCGNVFADLGLPDPEQDMTKANLVHAVADIVRSRGLSQMNVAKWPSPWGERDWFWPPKAGSPPRPAAPTVS